MDLDNIYRVFHTGYTSDPAANESLSNMDHTLGHKINLNKFRRMVTTLCMLSDYDTMIVKIYSNQTCANNTNLWRLNNSLFNDE